MFEALRSRIVPDVVLVVGLLSTLAAWRYVDVTVRAQREARFHELVSTSTVAVHDRMEAYTAMLRAARGLFDAAAPEPSGDAFREFIASLELSRQYPGIQGLGWSRYLLPQEVSQHEAAVRAAGRPGYRVWPPGVRAAYSSIVHLEPLDWRNQRAIGFDMFSEPIRREAMERARDTGEVTASGRVELVQEAGTVRQAGFLMYLPVYARPPTAPTERPELLRGWVYAPFRAEDLFRGILGTEHAGFVGLAVFDGAPASDTLLWDSGVDGDAVLLDASTQIDVGGRAWTLRFRATPAFASAGEHALPVGVVAVGALLSLLLFGITRAEARARERAVRSARRASFLAESGKVLASSLDYHRTLAQICQLAAERVADGCLVYVAEGAEPLWLVGHKDTGLARRAVLALRESGPSSDDELGPAAAIKAGHPLVLNGLDPRRATTPAGAHVREVLRAAGIRATLTVPLFARGEALGGMTLLCARGRRFDEDDVALAEDLARVAVAAIDTARLYRRAQEAVRARDEFLAIASHELKTPLTSLVLQSETLKTSARRGLVEAVDRKAEVIRRNVERLARLVSSLLDVSRIASGRVDLDLEEVDLADVTREVVSRFEEEARRAGCRLVVDAPRDVVGRWDRLRLDQIVTNLVSNAVKYGPGKPVEVHVADAGDTAVLVVRDHGIGISTSDQARIFERFERAVSRRNYGGFGLGLWIVREFVEALGGQVRVESSPGEGSMFTVELARSARDADLDEHAQATPRTHLH